MSTMPNNQNVITADRAATQDMLDYRDKNINSGQLVEKLSGVNNGARIELVPLYNKTDPEKLISGFSNCSITLGKDRPGGIGSGYGGKAFTGAAAIDLVAGRISSKPLSVENQDYFISNNFELDAARVYISQLADIDEYLSIPQFTLNGTQPSTTGIAKSTTTNNSVGKSAVAIISDHTRIIGRENVKIGTLHFGNLSTGNFVNKSGIDIIAGYNMPDQAHSLQPMVKGGNLLIFLEKIYYKLAQTQDTIQTLVTNQSKLNEFLIHHEHIINVKKGQTVGKLDDIKAMTDQATLITDAVNSALDVVVENIEDMVDFLTPGSKFYINSMWNRVN